MAENWPLLVFPVAAALFAFGLFASIAKIMSLFGWSKFALRHRTDGVPPSTSKSFYSQSLCFGRSIFGPVYRSCIKGWVDDRGITLVPSHMFRRFHPMLCLGWNDIKSIEQKSMLNISRTEVQMKEKLPVVIFGGEMGNEIYNHWQRLRPVGSN